MNVFFSFFKRELHNFAAGNFSENIMIFSHSSSNMNEIKLVVFQNVK